MRDQVARKKPFRAIPPPPGPEEGYQALVNYLHKYPSEELEKAGYLQEPTPEEIRELDEVVEHNLRREKAKGLAKDYPKASRNRTAQLAALLKCVPGLPAAQRKAIACSLNVIADKALDMDEIIHRILTRKYAPAQVAELLLAFDEMASYIRSYAEDLRPKLYDIFDQLKGLTPTDQATS